MLLLAAAWSIWWLLGALNPAIEPAPDFFDLTRIPLLLVFLGGGLWWLLFPLGLTAQTLKARGIDGRRRALPWETIRTVKTAGPPGFRLTLVLPDPESDQTPVVFAADLRRRRELALMLSALLPADHPLRKPENDAAP
jgi:hypothetical protein